MTAAPDLGARLREGLAFLDQNPATFHEPETVVQLRRSFERTLRDLGPDPSTEAAAFTFRMTGGQALVFLHDRAVSVDSLGFLRLIRSCGLELAPGETIVLDDALVATLIRRDVAQVSSELREAEAALVRVGIPRERDHAAFGVADRRKLQLRSRLNDLLSTLEAAQRGTVS